MLMYVQFGYLYFGWKYWCIIIVWHSIVQLMKSNVWNFLVSILIK